MRQHILAIASVTTLLTGVSVAAPDPHFALFDATPEAHAPEVVEIPVAADDFDRCVQTLSNVFLSPVDGAEVQSVSLDARPAPVVKCVIAPASS